MGINDPGTDQDQKQPGGSQGSQQPGADPYAPSRQGSGFTNLQRIIGANSQNQLGQAVGGGVTDAANQTSQNINNAQNQFQQDSNNSNLDTQSNRDSINSTYQTIQNQALPGQKSSGSNTLDQSNAAANMYTPNGASTANATPASNQYNPAQDQAKFSQYTSGQYQGPQNLNNLQGLQNQSADVNNLQQGLNTQEGRQGLLQRFVGGNNAYTSGQQNLDSLLLGQTGGQQLAQARLSTQALPDLNNLSQADQQVAQTYQNKAQDLANFTRQGAQGVAGNINGALKTQAEQQQAAADSQFKPLMQRINSGALTSDDQTQIKSLLGLDPNGPIYGSRDQILSALNQGIQEGKYNSSNVANQDQYAAQQALSQLTGQNAQQLGLNIDQAQVGKAGPAIYGDDAIKNQLASVQQEGADRFADQYKKTGILSQKELDYINSQPIQDEFRQVGSILNAGDQQDDTGKVRANSQVNSLQNDLYSKLAAQDQSIGGNGFNQYQGLLTGHQPGSTQIASLADAASLQGLNGGLGNYGGQRSYARGEGVSAFLANIAAQQNQRLQLEKANNYTPNLTSLLAGKSTPKTGNTAF